MRLRPVLGVLCALAGVPLVACGGGNGDGFGCTAKTCKAMFHGPGEQDLSSELGAGATVEVVTVEDGSVTLRIAERDVKLGEDKPRRVDGYRVTLTEVDGEDVTLRIVGE